ncbi:hypothetical protein A8F97_07795 [Pectobacterium parmentieri]|nr:hypothetical protein A8F97_07795 [Pectobacterium parmentieri]
MLRGEIAGNFWGKVFSKIQSSSLFSIDIYLNENDATQCAILYFSLYDSLCCGLSFNLLLRHLQWFEAADLIVKGVEGAIKNKTVTYDFERLMEGAKLRKCSEFAQDIIDNM